MDSTGLKVLLSIQRRADLAGGSFAVAGGVPDGPQDPGADRPGPDLRDLRDVDEAPTSPPPSLAVSGGAAPSVRIRSIRACSCSALAWAAGGPPHA